MTQFLPTKAPSATLWNRDRVYGRNTNVILPNEHAERGVLTLRLGRREHPILVTMVDPVPDATLEEPGPSQVHDNLRHAAPSFP